MKSFWLSFLLCLTSLSAFCYEQPGHETVGAIADLKLAATPVYTNVTRLLLGITLQQASILPDLIKNWESSKPDSIADIRAKTWKNIPDEVKAALLDFWKANKQRAASGDPLHRTFHYTDVSIDGQPLAYADARAGVNDMDIIHMIPYCAGVLKGTVPENNPRGISKTVAVILLAHYIGDLHQPLHVGAAYFNNNAKRRAPKNDHDADAKPDKGGNDIFYPIARRQTSVDSRVPKLHHYWDADSVKSAYRQLKLPARATASQAAQKLAAGLPASTDSTADLEKWTIKRGDRILPIAKEAHDRLEFRVITVNYRESGKKLTGIGARPKNGVDDYYDWAGTVVTKELRSGGADLAQLLTALLVP